MQQLQPGDGVEGVACCAFFGRGMTGLPVWHMSAERLLEWADPTEGSVGSVDCQSLALGSSCEERVMVSVQTR